MAGSEFVAEQVQKKLSLYRANFFKGVKIWIINSDEFIRYLPLFMSLIDEEEKYKASKIHFETHRQRFIMRKGILRMLLGAVSGNKPQQIQFSYNKFGKPFLDQVVHDRNISFNISHADELLLVGISTKYTIGVDIEKLKPLPDMVSLADMVFSAHEIQVLNELPEEQQTYSFFKGWVQKEAVSKAIGMGISMGFSNINVNISPEDSKDKSEYIEYDDGSGKHVKIFFFDKNSYFYSVVMIGER